jgi:hypothetical protein
MENTYSPQSPVLLCSSNSSKRQPMHPNPSLFSFRSSLAPEYMSQDTAASSPPTEHGTGGPASATATYSRAQTITTTSSFLPPSSRHTSESRTCFIHPICGPDYHRRYYNGSILGWRGLVAGWPSRWLSHVPAHRSRMVPRSITTLRPADYDTTAWISSTAVTTTIASQPRPRSRQDGLSCC